MKKQQARNLYYQTDLSQTRIAELLDIDRKTIYLWIKEGKWAQIKKSAQHTPSILAEQYYQQLLAINEMIANRVEQPYATTQEADIIRKLTLTIKNIKNGQTVGETVEVLMNFIDRVTKKDLELAKEILPYADEYIREQENTPIIKPPANSEEEENEEYKEEQHEQPPLQSQPQPQGSLRASKQSLTTQTENTQATQSPTQSQNHDQHISENSHINTGHNWGTNAQLIITAKQAETLAQLHLWSEFVKRMEQKIFLQNEENHQAPL